MDKTTKQRYVPGWVTALVSAPLVLGILYLSLYTSGSDPLKGIMQSLGLASVEVRYAIDVPSLCDALVSYYKNGALEQHTVDMLWTTTFDSKRGQPVSLSVQSQCAEGAVEAQIYVDGKLFQKASSSGAYAVAVASGGL